MSNVNSLKVVGDRIYRERMGETDYPNEGPEVEILAASLKGLFCKYQYDFVSSVIKGDSCSHSGTNLVHEDLVKAFSKLHAHLAVKCEEIEKSDIKDIDNIPTWDPEEVIAKRLTPAQEVSRKVFHFSVSSWKIDGTGEKEGVTLTGEKRLSTGEFVSLGTPKILWSGDYHFINELRVAIDDIRDEVKLYRNGKFAPKMEQAEMDFEEGSGDGKMED